MKGSNFFCEPALMFEAASFSLCSLFVLRPLVRGGEGAEKSSESAVSSDEGTRDASPWAEVSPPKSMGSFFEPGDSGVGSSAVPGGHALLEPLLLLELQFPDLDLAPASLQLLLLLLVLDHRVLEGIQICFY